MRHLLSKNGIARTCVRAILIVLSLLAGQASVRAQCGVSLTPNPLAMVSIDWYDSITGEYRFTSPLGRGIVSSYSSFPNCVQGSWATEVVPPLDLLAIASPVQYGDLWLSQFLFGDTGALGVIPYYPFVAGGVLQVVGVDVTTGEPFAGTTVIALTVFQQFI